MERRTEWYQSVAYDYPSEPALKHHSSASVEKAAREFHFRDAVRSNSVRRKRCPVAGGLLLLTRAIRNGKDMIGRIVPRM
jgi:hypothetical protein